ncbi:MAG: DNA-3-methyladenine glycosylase I [Planctomycetota bacterium]|jgi:DNA-3-methyladenine glycosylase I
MADNLQTDSAGVTRCSWCGDKEDYIAYHDDEWGLPMADDRRLFEKIVLEGFQSGLSWLTILRKRENFRKAFAGFDAAKVARFNHRDIERLVTDAGIVRHRGKIEAAINNGQAAVEMIEAEGSLAAYFWRFEDRVPFTGLVAQTDTSKGLSRDLKKRGWRFVGPTTAYAFMQAMGLVNDHVPGCEARDRVEAARTAFTPPT